MARAFARGVKLTVGNGLEIFELLQLEELSINHHNQIETVYNQCMEDE